MLTIGVSVWLGTTQGHATNTNQISSVSPSSAPQGTNGLLVTFTLSSTPPPPPTIVAISSVSIGSVTGTASPHTNQYIISGLFNIPGNVSTGAQNVLITYGGGFVVSYKATGFTITPATALSRIFTATPTNGVSPLTVNFTDASVSTVTNWLWDFGDGITGTDTNPVHTYYCRRQLHRQPHRLGFARLEYADAHQLYHRYTPPTNGAYAVVDTGQTNCYNDTAPPFHRPRRASRFTGRTAIFPASSRPTRTTATARFRI